MKNPINRLYTVNGFTGTYKQISNQFKIPYKVLIKRLEIGWSFEDAVNRPVRIKNKIYTANGYSGKLKDISRKYNCDYSKLNYRIKMGYSVPEAIEISRKEV